MRKPSRNLALYVALGLVALETWRISRIPVPVEDEAVHRRYENTIEDIDTEDGITLRLKRYPNSGATPVILANGFTSNMYTWDLPWSDANLAVYLRECGYDVWIANFRGCGREPYLSDSGSGRYSVDHQAALDIPALINGVTETTGRLPVWIGHSMGGISLYMYLQGVRVIPEDGDSKTICDRRLAEERNRSLLGGITIGSPSTFQLEAHQPFGPFQHSSFVHVAVKGSIIILRRVEGMFPRFTLVRRLGDLFGRFPRLGKAICLSPLDFFKFLNGFNPDNIDRDVEWSVYRLATDNMPTGVVIHGFRVLADGGNLVDYHREYDYHANMHIITTPLLFITGTRDVPEGVRGSYEAVSSARKEYVNHPGYGHIDMVIGKRAKEEIWPGIREWINRMEAED